MVPRFTDGTLLPGVVVVDGRTRRWDCLQRRTASAATSPHLSEYLYGRLLSCTNDTERRAVLREAVALAKIACARNATNPGCDAWAIYQLLFDLYGQTERYEEAKRICANALFGEKFSSQSEARAREDLQLARKENVLFLGVGRDADGSILVQPHQCSVLWVYSESPLCVRLARKELGADVVIQFSVRARRVLIVARDVIGPRDANGQRCGSLLAITTTLRLLDARFWIGGMPQVTGALCDSGDAYAAGAYPVFSLSPSGDVCKNWNADVRRESGLTTAQMEHAIRLVMDARTSIALRAAVQNGKISAEALAAACVPPNGGL